jgi:RsiW-degrading membrane proteinase PrsW (M82 family)
VVLPDAAATSLREQSRPVWQRAPFARVQGTTAKRFNTTFRAIAVGAGAGIGFMAGARVGYAVTPKRGPDDDTSGLKGVMIGAPIGAVLGAVLGWLLTK